MDALEAILSRRSIRRYTDQPVSAEQIDTLLQAAMAAPSANNEQPWHFIIIQDRQILEEITRVHPYAQMLKDAPLGVCVCADRELEKGEPVGYWVQDCSAATENILLAAHALGLGACWLGIHPRPEREKSLSKLLNLPDRVAPFCVIAIGQPAEVKTPAKRYTSERVHHDQW